MTSRLDGPVVAPDDDGRAPAGGSTPALVATIVERAADDDGVEIGHRRRLPGRAHDVLWTAAWKPETGEQITAVWTCSPDDPFQWTFDRLTYTADHRHPGLVAIFDADDVEAALDRFFT